MKNVMRMLGVAAMADAAGLRDVWGVPQGRIACISLHLERSIGMLCYDTPARQNRSPLRSEAARLGPKEAPVFAAFVPPVPHCSDEYVY